MGRVGRSENRARVIQRERFAGRQGIYANAHMAPRDIRAFCRVSDGADALLRTAFTRLGLSARAYHRILKIARMIADLDGTLELQPKHVSEALQYRSLDRREREDPAHGLKSCSALAASRPSAYP